MQAWRIRQRRAKVEEEAKAAEAEIVRGKKGQFNHSGLYANSDYAEFEIKEDK